MPRLANLRQKRGDGSLSQRAVALSQRLHAALWYVGVSQNRGPKQEPKDTISLFL